MSGDPTNKYVGASEGTIAVRARTEPELVRAEASTDGRCNTDGTGCKGKVKTVASAGTSAAAAVACAGPAVSMAISLGKADAVAAVASACQAVVHQAPKNMLHTPHEKLNFFSLPQISPLTIDVKHVTEANCGRARETELCCVMQDKNTSYLL